MSPRGKHKRKSPTNQENSRATRSPITNELTLEDCEPAFWQRQKLKCFNNQMFFRKHDKGFNATRNKNLMRTTGPDYFMESSLMQ